MLKDPQIGKLIVPIIPDEGRTFGMESIIRQVGIYASQGQLYKPHDQDMLLYYREEKNGQILEEGITEAGSMASFTAAGTAYSNYHVPMIPFFTYYSMFGFQRVGDMIWAFADARGKGFLMGGTAGRTTLGGEGLQHQDGHSLVLSSTVPTCATLRSGVRLRDRRHRAGRHAAHVPGRAKTASTTSPSTTKTTRCPRCRRVWKKAFCAASTRSARRRTAMPTVQLFGSGPILNEALRAQEILAEKYGVSADVWSVTSYNELRRDALAIERWNRLHPAEPEKRPYILNALDGADGPIIAATDYMKVVPDQLGTVAGRAAWCRWAPTASDAATIASTCGGTSK